MIFYFFLSNLYHTITCGSAKCSTQNLSFDNLCRDVFDPLSTDVMKDIQEHVVIKDQELTYTGTNPVHKTSKKDRLS